MTRRSSTPARPVPLGLLLLLAACGSAEAPPPDEAIGAGTSDPAPAAAAAAQVEPTEPEAAEPEAGDLVDPEIADAPAGEAGWNYQQRASGDLDGDGAAEEVVLSAQVEMYQGRPAWDDGQAWQVYVEEADGTRTRIYARRLQLGTLAMRLGLGADGAPDRVILIEHLPDRFSVYTVEYAAPGSASARTAFEASVDPRGETASPALP